MITIKKEPELEGLPNFHPEFAEQLADLGVVTVDDLRTVLADEERTASMLETVQGLGPRTVAKWKDILLSEEYLVAEEAPAMGQAEVGVAESAEIEPPVERVEAAPLGSGRDQALTTEDLKALQETAFELLSMNAAKKKGLMATVDYVADRLRRTGLSVAVEQGKRPTITAKKGENGLVLWGHLDTERMAGMDRRDQGEVRDEMIFGRGAANSKGAVAAIICAAEKMAGWDVPLSIVLTTDALSKQKGAERLAKDPAVIGGRGVLMLRPTRLRPVVGQSGYAAVRIKVRGKDPVIGMASFLDRMRGIAEGGAGRTVVRVGMVRGGRKKAPLEAAQTCKAVLEVMTLNPVGSVLDTMEGTLRGVDGSLKVLDRKETVRFDPSSELAGAMAELTGRTPVFELVRSEASKIAPVNPRVCVWGPGTPEVAASNIEYLAVRDLERTCETILRLVDRTAERPAQSG